MRRRRHGELWWRSPRAGKRQSWLRSAAALLELDCWRGWQEVEHGQDAVYTLLPIKAAKAVDCG